MKKNYFVEGSDALLALEGMIAGAGTVNVLYAMSVILRKRGATLRAMQVEQCAGQLHLCGNVLEFSIRDRCSGTWSRV